MEKEKMKYIYSKEENEEKKNNKMEKKKKGQNNGKDLHPWWIQMV